MVFNQIRFQYLFEQFCNNTCTPEENREFWELLAMLKEEDQLNPDDQWLWDNADVSRPEDQIDWSAALDKIRSRVAAWDGRQTPVRRLPKRALAAACIILLAGIGVYTLIRSTIKPTSQQRSIAHLPPVIKDVPPGNYGATLTLTDGKRVVLDSAGDRTIAVQGGNEIVNQNSQLTYLNNNSITTEAVYNTLSTDRGRQYKVVLADGSAVWLNALSSIRYPTSFNHSERRVSITGEVYFEIKGDARKPFIVTTGGMDIRVLGTHFNVNAYPDEAAAATTLLEGSIKVSRNADALVLLPGQQSLARKNGSLALIRNADVAAAVAWKNGYFTFDDTDIKSVMKQLTRWYDIDVRYEGDVAAERFWGDLPRNASLSTILNTLERTGVRFRMDGNTVVVLSGR
jgi:hypothetical protein